MTSPLTDLQAYIESFIKEHNIPALSVAIWQNNQLSQAAVGCLNLNTGAKATPDSIFQIGSIAKVMTTSLVMQLVDENRIDLDKPVQHYLRDFMIADNQASRTITVRQLLNHSSGIVGDYFPDDYAHQGNLIARYVDRCSQLPLVHRIGEMCSYSNAAFCVAGRLVEVVRGISWYQAMDENVYQPLGMNQAIANPVDVIRHSAAMGHVYDANNTEQWVVPERAYLTMGLAPAGTTAAMAANNLIRFARAHMEMGNNQEGQSWLSTASVEAMQTPHITLPNTSQLTTNYYGLGWGLRDYNKEGLRVVRHNGGTHGFEATLQFMPEKNIAFVALMNGVSPSALAAVSADLLGALTGVGLTEPEPDSILPPEQLQDYVGVYESFDTVITVTIKDQALYVRIEYKHDPLPTAHLNLRHVEASCFATYSSDDQRGNNIIFLEPNPQGQALYVFNGGRLNTRCS